MGKEIEDKQVNNDYDVENINNNSKQFIFSFQSMRVVKMLIDTITLLLFLVAVIHFILKVYILGIAFVILGVFCFIYLRKNVYKAEKESRNRGENLIKRSLKEDFKEYGKILKDIWKYARNNIFKVLSIIVMSYISILFIIVSIIMLLNSLLK